MEKIETRYSYSGAMFPYAFFGPKMKNVVELQAILYGREHDKPWKDMQVS